MLEAAPRSQKNPKTRDLKMEWKRRLVRVRGLNYSWMRVCLLYISGM